MNNGRDALKEKVKSLRPLYRLYGLAVYILWLILLFTLAQTFRWGRGLLLIWLEERGVLRFLTAAAIRSVAETIGFGNILLVWIYAVLDKQELGLRYSSLLRAVYPIYHVFVVIHLVAILLCIWLSEAGVVDGALLALAIVILGGGIHWKALFLLVFSSENRRRAAADEWERRLVREEVDKYYLNELCDVTAILRLEKDPAAQRILRYFYQGLERYAMSIGAYTSAGETQVQRVLLDLAQVWNLLLRPRASSERLILAGEILRLTEAQEGEGEQSRRAECLGAVCLAYVICIYRLCDEESAEAGEEDVIRRVKQQLQLAYLRCECLEVAGYLQVSEQMLAWMSFYFDRIPFDTDLFEAKGRVEQPGDRELLHAMAGLLFRNQACGDVFDLIYPQLFESGGEQTEGEGDKNDSAHHSAEADCPVECGVL